jgi:hypothetical protein
MPDVVVIEEEEEEELLPLSFCISPYFHNLVDSCGFIYLFVDYLTTLFSVAQTIQRRMKV